MVLILQVFTQETSSIIRPLNAYTADGADVSAVAVNFLGYSSGSFSTLKNISKWPLKALGSNIALYSYLCEQIAKHFTLENALAAPEAAQRTYTFMDASGAVTPEQIQAEVTRRIHNILPILSKHRQLSSSLASRWGKFLQGLESSYGLDSNEKLKNFLLGFYTAQQLHLEELPDIAKMEELIKTNALQLKQDNRTLQFAHIRESVLAGNISRHKEDQAVAFGHRSPLYQSFSSTGSFPMQKPHQVDLCVPPNVHPSCNTSAIPDTPPPPPKPVEAIHKKILQKHADLLDLHQYLNTLGGERKKRETINHTTSIQDHETPFVVDVKNSYCFWRWCKQLGTDQPWQRVTDHQIRKLNKRFVFMAVLAVASIISLLSSIAVGSYAGAEISYIHKSLSSTDKAVSSLIHSMDVLDGNLHRLDRKTDSIGEELVNVCKVVDLVNFDKTVLTLDAGLTDYYNSMSEHILDHELAFSDLRRSSFPYTLADFSSLQRLYAELKTRARQIGQTLLLDSPTGLFQTQTTLFFADQNPYLLSSIPTMSEQSQPLEILRLSLDPVLLSNTSFTYSSDYPVVITNKERTFFQELTSDEFDNCKHLRHTGRDFYFCQYNSGVFSKDIKSSCIMSLLHSDPASSKVCQVTIGHLRDYVKQLDHETFLLYSPKEDHITVACPRDGHRKMIPFTGFHKIQLQPGCMADTVSHRIYRGLDEVHHRSLTTISRPIDVKQLFSSLTSNVPRALSIIQGHLEKLVADNHPVSINLDDAQQAIADALAREGFWNRIQEHKFEILMGISGLLLSLTLLYFTIRFVNVRRRRLIQQREQRELEEEQFQQVPDIIRQPPVRDLRRALLPPGVRP